MSIPVMGLLPQFASSPTAAKVAPAGAANSEGNAAPHSNGFDGLLASLSAAPTAGSRPSQQDAPALSRTSASDARDQLQQALSSLAGGKVDLNAPGLGLTAQQQQQLLSNLKKLLDGSTGDGAELLASLLAASQLAATIQPNDLAALTQLLGTTAQGTVSVDALASNLHLLAQAVQVVASSDGKLTLVQAVQELTPPADAFTQQLAAALAQPETQAVASEVPVATDTGPPRGQSPGDAAGAAASANAGSNGRELTVTPTGATSPADGAVQEANSQAETSPQVSDLAKAIEALLQTQPEAKPGQPAAAVAVAGKSAPVLAPPIPPDAAVQLSQMAPVAAAQMKVAPTTSQAPAPVAGPAGSDKSGEGPSTSTLVPATADSVAGITLREGSQDHNPTPDSGHQQTDGSTTGGQAVAVPVGSVTPGTFAAALDVSHTAAADVAGRPAVEQVVIDQVVQSATLALNNGQQEFRVQLKPDFLGAMEVRVSVNNGVVDVRMSVESAATRQLIDNNISQLRQAFGNGEVRVQQVPNLTSSDAPWTFGQGGQQGFWQGQNPYSGSPLPEAIPFSEAEQGTVATVAALDSGPQTQSSPAPSLPGAVDLQA